MNKSIKRAEAVKTTQALLEAIERGEVRLTSEKEPQEVYASVCVYTCHGGAYDGVRLGIFIDCKYGIPGYLRFVEEVWEGFTGARTPDFLDRLAKESVRLGQLDKRLVGLIKATLAVPDGKDPTKDKAIRAALLG